MVLQFHDSDKGCYNHLYEIFFSYQYVTWFFGPFSFGWFHEEVLHPVSL